MRPLSSLPASLLLVAAVAGPAVADEQTPVQPAFAIMDNTGDPSHIAADVAMSIKDGGDGMFARTNVLGQFLSPSGFGGYAGVAASTVLFEEDSEESPTELGNLQLGGVFQTRLSATGSLGIRAGLILPTSTGDEDDFGGFLHAIGTALTRPADAATASPDATWLRLGVSPTYHARGLFMRADAGLDVPVIDADGLDPIGHVNLGIGFGQSNVSGTFELQNVFTFRDEIDDLADRFFHVGAVSLRYHAGNVAPFVALSLPLDDGARDEFVMLTLGLNALL